MAEDWREYQKDVAAAFPSLGANAEVDAHVKGARGEHDVDVWVTFTTFGLEIRWLVECKLWSTAVTKEKVVALYQIAQDVGADRALLFSESGFQAGAIKAVANTNVSLTSLAVFRENAEDELVDTTLVRMIREAEKLHSQIKPLWIDENGRIAPIPGTDLDELVGLDGAVLFFKLALHKALSREFPISYPGIADCRAVLSRDATSLLKNAAASLSEVREWLAKFEPAQQRAMGTVDDRAAALVLAVEELTSAAEECLFGIDESDPRFEELRLQALGKMKAVGRASQALYGCPDSNVHEKVRLLIRLLVDTVYLYLTLPTIRRDWWESVKSKVEEELTEIKKMTKMP